MTPWHQEQKVPPPSATSKGSEWHLKTVKKEREKQNPRKSSFWLLGWLLKNIKCVLSKQRCRFSPTGSVNNPGQQSSCQFATGTERRAGTPGSCCKTAIPQSAPTLGPMSDVNLPPGLPRTPSTPCLPGLDKIQWCDYSLFSLLSLQWKLIGGLRPHMVRCFSRHLSINVRQHAARWCRLSLMCNMWKKIFFSY